ncbi:MAG: hypothetical protein AAB837_00940 [Patescibacteria group bacterium]
MKRTFVVPESLAIIAKEVVVAVITSIPNGWAVLRGCLHAPKKMLDSGEALMSTKLVFDSSIAQMIAKTKTDQVADIFGVLIEGKKPESIEFGRNFGYCEVMPMRQSKLMAAYFIQLGYRGRLTFRWRDQEGGEDVHFGCMIWLPSDKPDIAPIFKIESNCEDYPDSGGTVAPTIKICEEMRLSEKEPEVVK